MNIWVAIFFQFILLIALLGIMWQLFRLFFNAEARQYPPYIPTFGNEKRLIIKNVAEILKNAQQPMVVLDPGCGSASLLTRLAKDFPQHQFVGIEWNYFLYMICKLKTRKQKNMNILNQNMFENSFEGVDIIVCFLLPPLMEKFGQKIINECGEGIIVFSNSFQIPNLQLIKTYTTKRRFFIKNVYSYKK